MKQTLTVSALFFLLAFSLASPALAEDATSSVTPARNRFNFREQIQEKINQFKENRQELKEEREENKEDRQEARKTATENRQENRFKNAQAIIKRLRQGIISRYENTLKHKTSIEERIAKIEEANKTAKKKRDLTAVKAKLTTFNTAVYVKDLAAFDAKVTEILTSTTPHKLTPELKILAKTLQSDIKSLRQVLADTLRLIIKSKKL